MTAASGGFFLFLPYAPPAGAAPPFWSIILYPSGLVTCFRSRKQKAEPGALSRKDHIGFSRLFSPKLPGRHRVILTDTLCRSGNYGGKEPRKTNMILKRERTSGHAIFHSRIGTSRSRPKLNRMLRNGPEAHAPADAGPRFPEVRRRLCCGAAFRGQQKRQPSRPTHRASFVTGFPQTIFRLPFLVRSSSRKALVPRASRSTIL